MGIEAQLQKRPCKTSIFVAHCLQFKGWISQQKQIEKRSWGSCSHLVFSQLLALHQLFHPPIQLLHRTPFLRTHFGGSTSVPPQQLKLCDPGAIWKINMKKLHNLSLVQISPLAVRPCGGSRLGGEVVLQLRPHHCLQLRMRSSSKNVHPAHVHTRPLTSRACSETPGPLLGASFSFCCWPSLTLCVHK